MPDDKRKPTKSDPASADPRPFDVKTVEYLVRLMAEHDLAEVDLKEGEHRVRIRKSGAFVAPAVAVAHPPAPAHAAAAAHAPAASAPAGTPPAAAGPKLLEVKSELIGTFYAKPKPDKDDYVKVGSKVTPDTVVCQIEAMKIFNEIKAGVSGTVREVCVKNGDFVDFGAVLLRVDPS